MPRTRALTFDSDRIGNNRPIRPSHSTSVFTDNMSNPKLGYTYHGQVAAAAHGGAARQDGAGQDRTSTGRFP